MKCNVAPTYTTYSLYIYKYIHTFHSTEKGCKIFIDFYSEITTKRSRAKTQ
eukprot:m.83162 g.83162  ORF g.83162 m.83162 type:complete len:51 (+) comp12113_c0_seq1:1343-1495(+)